MEIRPRLIESCCSLIARPAWASSFRGRRSDAVNAPIPSVPVYGNVYDRGGAPAACVSVHIEVRPRRLACVCQ
eukprot:1410952-Pyramimonas_sp.AAC.1